MSQGRARKARLSVRLPNTGRSKSQCSVIHLGLYFSLHPTAASSKGVCKIRLNVLSHPLFSVHAFAEFFSSKGFPRTAERNHPLLPALSFSMNCLCGRIELSHGLSIKMASIRRGMHSKQPTLRSQRGARGIRASKHVHDGNAKVYNSLVEPAL